MGILVSKGEMPTQVDALVAKNYCTEEELSALNRVVTAYLKYAEMKTSEEFLCIYLIGLRHWMALLNCQA